MNDEEMRKQIASNLAYYRKMNKLTQLDVAEALSYSDKSVSKWERGEGTPDVINLKRIADLYHVSLNDLISPNQKKHPPLAMWNKVLLTCLACGLVVLIATLIFVILSILPGEYPMAYMSFIYAIPISSIIVIVLSSCWHKRIVCSVAVSTLVWTAGLSVYLSAPLEKMWLIFILCGVMQVLVIIWFFFRRQFCLLKKLSFPPRNKED